MTRQHGFTLIELAIVLVIMTILIGGLAMPLSAQIQARRIAETNKTLEEARKAIIGYAMRNSTNSNSCLCKYQVDNSITPPTTVLSDPSSCAESLCPARENLAATTDAVVTLTLEPRHRLPCPSNDGTGIESRDADNNCVPCNDANGDNRDDVSGKRCNLLPWVTLGTADQDAWGNRLSYGVSDAFSGRDGFYNSTPGDKKVCSGSSSGACDSVVADKVPVVILSHGPNGWGAQSSNGTILASPTGDDEKTNLKSPSLTGHFYVSRSPYKPTDGSAAELARDFDDLVVWISDGLLKSRVCPDGGCR